MSEISLNRPKTAREEAAAAERSKREAEMAELRRLRAEQMQKQKSTHMTAADLARKKREEEMDELRRLKSGENAEMRKKLDAKGGSLATDMRAWEMNQSNAKKGDHNRKVAAQSNLQGYRGNVGTKTAADMDKAAMSQAQRDQMTKMGQMTLDGDNLPPDVTVDDEIEKPAVKEAVEPAEADSSDRRTSAVKEAADSVEADISARRSSRGVMFKQGSDEQIPVAKATPPPAASPSPPAPERKMPPKRTSDVSEGDTVTLRAPTYTRVDIKFSFGLIVRSSAADGFETENLRDNETLKKCMEGTMKILKDQMHNPPDLAKLQEESNGRSSFTSFKVKFPEAYYDSLLEPTVISIEEDKKAAEEGKVTAKGNKRTLVKASFPVFLRDEAIDDEGTKRSARMLKETKTTVFKALRAAVSGGSFLR